MKFKKKRRRKKHSRAPSAMSGAAEEKRKSGPAVRGELQIAHEGPKGNSREEKGKSFKRPLWC